MHRAAHSNVWLADGAVFDVFVARAVLFEAIVGAPHSALAPWASASVVERLRRKLSLVPLPAWSWPAPPHTFHAAPGGLVSICPNADGWTVWIGAHAEETVEQLGNGMDWR